jgi:hypothetical protein
MHSEHVFTPQSIRFLDNRMLISASKDSENAHVGC